jgi:hypothetical protein
MGDATKRRQDTPREPPAKRPALRINAFDASPFALIPLEITAIILGYATSPSNHMCMNLDDYGLFPQGGRECLIPFFSADKDGGPGERHYVCVHSLAQFACIRLVCSRFLRCTRAITPRFEIDFKRGTIPGPPGAGPVVYVVRALENRDPVYAYFIHQGYHGGRSSNPSLESLYRRWIPRCAKTRVLGYLEEQYAKESWYFTTYGDHVKPDFMVRRQDIDCYTPIPEYALANAFVFAYNLIRFRCERFEALVIKKLGERLGTSCGPSHSRPATES